jgi:CARDB/Leishmanolysin/Bacterial pre-peptidase C-terminal domain/Bacterial Ig-like domain (group 2)
MRVGLSRVLASVLLVASISSCGGGDGGPVTPPPPPSPRATQITVAPASGALGFLGETTNFTATVRDQNGSVMNVTVTWTSSNTAAVTITSSGIATAVANGTATITASASGLTATAEVTVLQVATQLLIVSGDGQSGTVGETLATALVVQSSDGGGAAMEGISVAFSASGAGTVSAAAATSDAEGRASTVWTLGTNVAAGQQVTAVMGEDADQVVFNATLSPGAPAAFQKVSGDAQLAARGTTLAAPLVASVTDAFDNVIPGVDVTFAVTGGGGALETPNAQTDANGRAQTNWTLGGAPGANTATATAAGFTTLQFTATGVGVPDLRISASSVSPPIPTHTQTVTFTATIQNDGDGPNVIDVPVAFSVDNVRLGTVQTGTVAANGGQVTLNFQGGPFAAGGHSYSIEVDPDGELAEDDENNNIDQGIFQVIQATVLTDGVPATNLSGDAGSTTFFVLEVAANGAALLSQADAGDYDGPVAASVKRGGTTQKYHPIRYFERPGALDPSLASLVATALQIDLSGNNDGEDADLYVKFGAQPSTTDFDFRSIGGTNTESLTINSPQVGTWHILLHGSAAYSGVTLAAAVGEVGQQASNFDIELVFLTSATASQTAAFESARTRWQAAIIGDLPDVNFGTQPVAADACVDGQPAIVDIVDDLRIYVSLIPIDGAFGTLGQAGPCFVRGGTKLPIVGSMEFDTADMSFLETNNQLVTTILHEMGHVLGFGFWGPDGANLLVNPSLPSSPGVDTHFTGAGAIAAFDAAGGTAYVGGEKVPVENQLGEGSGDSHWRESVLAAELMTPVLDNGVANPMSAISIASMGDVGYTVNTGVADAYALNLGAAAAVAGKRGPVINLGDDYLRRPVIVVDKNGRILGVIRHE